MHRYMYFLGNYDRWGNLLALSLVALWLPRNCTPLKFATYMCKPMYVANCLSTSSVGVSVITDTFLGIFSRIAASPFAFFEGSAASFYSLAAVEF